MTQNSSSVPTPAVVVDERREFERLRHEELRRLETKIADTSATVRSIFDLEYIEHIGCISIIS